MRIARLPQHSISRIFIVLILLSLSSVGCATTQNQTNTRPACVTLSSYSGVIEQVMQIQPDWVSTSQVDERSQYQWTIQDENGNHTLTVKLSSEGCVCATNAKSHFSGSDAQGKLAGLMQGAAVAPISELDYTSEWLEPRLIKNCIPAFLLKNSYEDETTIKDGATWKLTCSRMPGTGNREIITSLTILTPECTDAFD